MKHTGPDGSRFRRLLIERMLLLQATGAARSHVDGELVEAAACSHDQQTLVVGTAATRIVTHTPRHQGTYVACVDLCTDGQQSDAQPDRNL